MPNITVEGPPLSVEKKRELVAGLTDAAIAAYEGIPREAFFVLINENQPENVGVGGELLADRQAKSAGQRRAGQAGAGQRSG